MNNYKFLKQLIPSRIFVSFSGGRTSAYMCWWFKTVFEPLFPWVEVVYVFANTGQEAKETYLFVDNVNAWLGLKLIKIEAIVNKGRHGSTYRVVSDNYRGPRLFRDMARKYGIPGPGFLHCTRELKINPMKSYIKSIWGDLPYWTAIGIRSDETDRMDDHAEKKRYWYPLVSLEVTKDIVNEFWMKQEFTLNIPDWKGNCVTCWKKSDRKLGLVAQDDVRHFDCFKELERDFISVGAGKNRKIWRKKRTTDELLSDVLKGGDKDDSSDFTGCQESCEVF